MSFQSDCLTVSNAQKNEAVTPSEEPPSEEPKGLFVTGTDTGVGKTLVSAAITGRLHCHYWKPVQTGPDREHDLPEVRRLTGLSNRFFYPSLYSFPEPLSPHEAAKAAGQKIDFDCLLPPAGSGSNFLVVEGAGGVLVPLDDKHLMVDLMERLALPVLLVARSSLGTINHTLLSLMALRARGMPVFGVVLSGPENPANREAIESYGKVRVWAELPKLQNVTPQSLTKILHLFDPLVAAITSREE